MLFRSEVPSVTAEAGVLSGEGAGVMDLMVQSGLCASKGQARKDIEGGGIYLNNERVTSVGAKVGVNRLLFGKYMLLRKGKRIYVLMTFR